MPDQAIIAQPRAYDANGYPAGAATMDVYATGTNTRIDVYLADGNLTTNPVVADATGAFVQIFPSETAKVVVKDADGVTLYTLDPAPMSLSGQAGASQVSTVPTATLPFANVQTALDGMDVAWRGALSTAGVGITGDATLIPNIDTTSVQSGNSRFDGTTSGTFPSGVTAATTGLVEVDRQSAAQATMWLRPAGTNVVYVRHLAVTWGAWSEVVTALAASAEGDTLYKNATAWTRLAKGAAGTTLRMNTGATAPEWAGAGYTFIAAVATTAGTTVEISAAIPAYANEILLACDAVGQTGGAGSDKILVQIGTSGGYAVAGYTSATGDYLLYYTDTTGFAVMAPGGGDFTGTVRLFHVGANKWFQDHNGFSSNPAMVTGSGFITLGAALTKLRISRTGAETLSTGSVILGYR